MVKVLSRAGGCVVGRVVDRESSSRSRRGCKESGIFSAIAPGLLRVRAGAICSSFVAK